MTDHKPGCMALQAWEESGVCTCASSHSSSPPQVSDRMREAIDWYGLACHRQGTLGIARAMQSPLTTQAHMALLREIAALEAKTTWQPIETAINEHGDILLYCEDTREQFVGLHVGRGEYQYATGPDGTVIVCRPTHWMPLPEAPHA